MLLEGELNQLLAVSPKFGGSTGGWLQAAETEEKYAITWASKKEQISEIPTSGASIMQKRVNLLYLSKKEQFLALDTKRNSVMLTLEQVKRGKRLFNNACSNCYVRGKYLISF